MNGPYAQIDDIALAGLQPPGLRYLVAVQALAAIVLVALAAWVLQVRLGMGITGINHPVGWGVYIANFVFWVGIAHSGTLISAILHLLRSRWRCAVARSAEAMTVFAVFTAGLFPLIHLGRLWVFWYILPYPSERQLWPDFVSPLIWDVCAVCTYLTVSAIFFYVGMIPDLATARDRWEASAGPDHPRTRIYRRLALGWCGAAGQWRHYGRGYLYFAALATPLVISVHSVVSWDFAMTLLPGWHTTIQAPYFVAGAIHSGLAMVLTLMIPMRHWLRLERIVTDDHLEALAKVMLVTTAIVGYAYVVEPCMAWYSGDRFEWQFAKWRATGWMAPSYWALFVLNVGVPLAFLARRVRRNPRLLFVIAILVNIGMWLERYVIIVGSTSHDFLPHNWRPYVISPTEATITAGSFAFFLLWFLLFTRLLPAVAGSEVKALLAESEGPQDGAAGPAPAAAHEMPEHRATKFLAVFATPEALLAALHTLPRAQAGAVEVFSPINLPAAVRQLCPTTGPVRFWTLAGALAGCIGGFWLAIGTAGVNGLIVGGKHPVSIIPYCVVGFEGTVLIGSLANLTGLIVHARLGGRRALPPGYDRRFSRDRFGLLASCEPGQTDDLRRVLAAAQAEDVRELA